MFDGVGTITQPSIGVRFHCQSHGSNDRRLAWGERVSALVAGRTRDARITNRMKKKEPTSSVSELLTASWSIELTLSMH